MGGGEGLVASLLQGHPATGFLLSLLAARLLTTVGSTTPNATVNGYSTRDVNLNGQVKYTGSANDRDPILINVGSTTPNATRSAQLP